MYQLKQSAPTLFYLTLLYLHREKDSNIIRPCKNMHLINGLKRKHLLNAVLGLIPMKVYQKKIVIYLIFLKKNRYKLL